MELFKGANAIWFLLAVLAVGAGLERLRPWRRGLPLDIFRWIRAGLLNFFGIALIGALPFISGFGAAVFAGGRGIGALNMIAVPFWAELLITLLAVDAVAFAQHWMLHRWGFLWRAHRTHHTDVTIDVSTSLRFHPLETLFRAVVEAPVIVLFGLPPEGVLAAFAVFTVVNSYTHFNMRLPAGFERALSPFLITPLMHRLHHTTDEAHQRANLGTLLSMWDRLAGSWRGPDVIAEDASFGVGPAEAPPHETLGAILLDPFRRTGTAPAPNRDSVRADVRPDAAP